MKKITLIFFSRLFCLLLCSVEISYAQQKPEATNSVVTNSLYLCKGSKALLKAEGVLSYTWSVGSNASFIVVQPSVTTSYTVTGKDALGNISQTITMVYVILVTPPFVVSINGPVNNTICAGESISLSAENGQEYFWYNAVNTTTFNTSSIVAFPNASTTYWVMVTNAAQTCVSMDDFSVIVNPCTGLSKLFKAELSIYPNPSSGSFTIQSGSNMEMMILNELGEIVRTLILSDLNEYKVNVTDLPAGLYFVVGSDGTSVFTERTVVLSY